MNSIKVDWQKVNGLLPTIVQDESGQVLMLAYVNEEALNLTIKSGFAHYFSRSKNRIWKKGETSNNTQIIKEIYLDCDNDAILFIVKQNGVACHTGNRSCFFNKIDSDIDQTLQKKGENFSSPYNIVDELYHIILDRKLNANPDNSYVAKLFNKGENAILKKIIEEAGEFSFAYKDLTKAQIYSKFNLEKFGEHNDDPKFDLIYECADLIFHIFVALAGHNIHPEQVLEELKRRLNHSGIDEKNSRKK